MFLLGSCNPRYTTKEQVTDFIPPEADFIFIFHDSKGVENDTKGNAFAATLAQAPAYQSFVENPFLAQFPISSKSIFALKTYQDSTQYLIATHLRSNNALQDSLAGKTVDSVNTKKGWLQRVKLKKELLFTTVIDSFLVVSNTEQFLVSALTGTKNKQAEVEKLVSLHTEGNLQVLFKTALEGLERVNQKKDDTWQGYQIQFPPESIQTTGVTFIKDSVPSTLWLLQGQKVQRHNTLQIIPLEAEKSTSFPLSEPSLFFERLNVFDATLTEKDTAHFDSVREVAHTLVSGAQALILESVSPAVFLNTFDLSNTTSSRYRDVTIYTNESIATKNKPLQLLFETEKLTTFFNIDAFFVFTENETIAQKIISAYLNKTVLANHPHFEKENNKLPTLTSLMHVNTNSTKNSNLNVLAPAIKTVSVAIPFSTLQYTIEGGFAHVHLSIFNKIGNTQIEQGISEKERIISHQVLIQNPQFFTNHRTKVAEVVMQDVTNTLFLYSHTGKKVWETKLNGAILGIIHEIDLFRNGKKQMAFVTPSAFHVLDRNGNAVAPFPIKFKDNITQPLAVFDYDNNRNYRFVITQDNDVFMYDSKGKQVKGFTYNKAPATIVMPPQHFRIANKDYITIASKNGKLDILSRTGKARIPLSKTFSFSEIPLQKEGNSLVIISQDNKKHTIATSGKISTQALEVSPKYYFAMDGKTKVTLDDNLLRINGYLIELPYGLYTAPSIMIHKGTTYVSVTDTQEKKVYVYGNNKLLEGFPVYGTTNAALTANANEKLLLVQGDDKEILRYSF